jgi:surface protein
MISLLLSHGVRRRACLCRDDHHCYFYAAAVAVSFRQFCRLVNSKRSSVQLRQQFRESSLFRMQTSQPPIKDIHVAVQLWFKDPAQATTEYGRIEEWDTSEVTDMSQLFFGQTEFNDDISGWDVSQVTDICGLCSMMLHPSIKT